jgi:hypothetical protein
MGLFGSIKKAVSKTWSGIKGAVKKVAATVKKVAKKVAYAIPGGKQLWDLSSKIGKGIMKGIGKITSKLGPIGTMALSFVLAPVMGPMISSLWSGFGAGAAAMASSANVLVSSLGTAGSSVFAAANWVGGAVGALGNAVIDGASQIMNGNGFSAAAESFATNMSNAFTGKAGMASVNAGAAQASAQSGTLANNAASSLTQEQAMSLAKDGVFMQSPVSADVFNLKGAFGTPVGSALNSSPIAGVDLSSLGGSAVSQTALDSQVAKYGMTVAQMNATPNAANAFITGGKDAALGITSMLEKKPSSFTDKLSEVASRAASASSLLGGGGGGGQQQGGYSPYVPKAINSTVANAGNVHGQGSSGFSLLGGVQGLEESLRHSQQLMFG